MNQASCPPSKEKQLQLLTLPPTDADTEQNDPETDEEIDNVAQELDD